jgi:hypothetical protein
LSSRIHLPGQAIDQLVVYLSTERGGLLRDKLVAEAVQALNTLEVETAQLLDGYRDLPLRAMQVAPAAALRMLFVDRDPTAGKGRVQSVLSTLGNRFLQEMQRSAPQNSTLQAFARTVKALQSAPGMDQKKVNQILRKVRFTALLYVLRFAHICAELIFVAQVLNEPVLTSALSEIASRLVERLTGRVVRRLLGDADRAPASVATSAADAAPESTS